MFEGDVDMIDFHFPWMSFSIVYYTITFRAFIQVDTHNPFLIRLALRRKKTLKFKQEQD